MRRLGSEKRVSHFSRSNRPAYTVKSGETVVVETLDAFSGLITSEDVLFEALSMDDVNPATGPIEVEGVRAGDTVAVRIERIDCGGTGVLMYSRDYGVLRRNVRKPLTKLVEVRKGRVVFNGSRAIPLNPHVGVIGVSPKRGRIPTYYPGDHGGNMDTVEVGTGSTLYLPASVDGAMLALGDVHAAMADGEVCGTGVEVSAEVTLSASKARDVNVKRPLIETKDKWITYAAAKTLDEAASLATADGVRLMMDMGGMDFGDAYMLASVVADLRISQVVDPLMAARMIVPKKYL